MSDWKLQAPVAFFIFKRPETTRQVFEVTQKVKPVRLFVIAEGPRTVVPHEEEKCLKTRGIIEEVCLKNIFSLSHLI